MIDLTRQGKIQRIGNTELEVLRNGNGAFLYMAENSENNNVYILASSGSPQMVSTPQIMVDEFKNVILIPNEGKVGIGKTPEHPLDVKSYACFGGGENLGVVIGNDFYLTNVGVLGYPSGGLIAGYTEDDPTTYSYGTSGATNGLFVKTTTGNWGINVKNPDARLHIRNEINSKGILIDRGPTNTKPIIVDDLNRLIIGKNTTASQSTQVEMYGGLYTDYIKIGSSTSTFNGPVSVNNTLSFATGYIQDAYSSIGTNAILTTDNNHKLRWQTPIVLGLLKNTGGTANYLTKMGTSGNTLNSLIYEINGNIGVNTTTPYGKLDVKLGTNQHILFSQNVNGTLANVPGIVSVNDTNTAYFPLGFHASSFSFGGGNIGFGITTPEEKIHVIGNAIISGGITTKKLTSVGNTTIGQLSGYGLTSGKNNIGVGDGSLRYTTSGENNIGLGVSTLRLLQQSKNNVAIGHMVMYPLSDNSSSGNTAIGALAASTKVAAIDNIYLGSNSQSLVTGLTTNEIVIGANAVGNGTNSVTLGNSDTTNIYQYGNIVPPISGVTIGTPTNYFDKIYCQTSEIDLSDARYKTEITSLNANELKAAKELSKEIGFYKFLSSIQEKGDVNARLHIGLTAQRAIEIMYDNGLNPFSYAFICYDIWPQETIIHPAVSYQKAFVETITDTSGRIIGSVNHPEILAKPEYVQVIREAGDRYSIRYTELLLFIARGFEERISALENNI